MNRLDEHPMELHVRVVAWLLIALNGMVLLVAVGLWLLMTSAAELVRMPEAPMILPLTSTLLPATIGALTLPGFIAAIGLLARKRWGRILGIVAGFLMLPGFPMGTLAGIYAVFILLQDSAKSYFDASGSRLDAAPRPA